MANKEYANRIHEILEETIQDRGTNYLSARVRARAMFQDYSLLKDTVLDPGLNLNSAQKLAEFIFSQSSFLLRGETDDGQQIESWLNLAAQAFEFLSKISDEADKDYLLINAAFSYHIAGYQANAQCLAKLLEERLATEDVKYPYYVPKINRQIRHFELQTGRVTNPLMPRADGWCCNLQASALRSNGLHPNHQTNKHPTHLHETCG